MLSLKLIYKPIRTKRRRRKNVTQICDVLRRQKSDRFSIVILYPLSGIIFLVDLNEFLWHLACDAGKCMCCTRTHISSKEKRSQEMNAFTELDSSLNCPYEAAFVHDLWPSVLFSFLIFCCKQLPLTLRNDTRYLRKAKFYFRSFFCTIPHTLSLSLFTFKL